MSRIPARRLFALTLLVATGLRLGFAFAQAPPPAVPEAAVPPRSVRVAAIGGIQDHEFWNQLAARFEQATQIKVETVATGRKDGASELFRKGGIDLITMQSNEQVIGLVADGWAMDAHPWVQSDLVLVGPEADPAGVKRGTDLADALKKIVASKSALVVHDNAGAHDVIRAVIQTNGIELSPQHTTYLLDDHQRRVITVAAERKAYTLIGRVPFRSGKLANAGLTVMAQGDPRLRRPYLVAVANPAKVKDARVREARRLAAFLRSPETQEWIATFGKGKFDDQPLFFPVTGADALAAPVAGELGGAVLTVCGEVDKPLSLTPEAFAKMPRRSVAVKGQNGKDATYEGVALRTILTDAGVPLGNHRMRGENLTLYLLVEAADGYRAVFALPELDDDFADRPIILADRCDGHALDKKEAPYRLIVADEARHARWVRQVQRLRIQRAGP